MRISIYFKVLGGHTHVRMFMNGGKCGDLVFRNEEFVVWSSMMKAGEARYGEHQVVVQIEEEE